MACIPAPVASALDRSRSSVTHELRSPLQTIMGFAELLLMEIKGPLNEEQKQYLSYIQRDSRHLLGLINEVLDLSRLEAGRLELELETLEAEPVMLEVLASMNSLAEARSISLESSLAPGVFLRADRARFREILGNLVDNAVKYTPERSRVYVEARKLGACARISVRDTGIGARGVGVGLTISRRLVELHGGKFWGESDPGKGNQFHFTIPLAPESL